MLVVEEEEQIVVLLLQEQVKQVVEMGVLKLLELQQHIQLVVVVVLAEKHIELEVTVVQVS
jgi:hypothetical protein